MKTYLYFAAGSGDFPTDMLRYDKAKIVQQVQEVSGLRGYILEGARPTDARWQSFLWSTAELRKRMPAGSSEAGPVIMEIKRGENDWTAFHYIPLQTCSTCGLVVRPQGGHLCGTCGKDI